MRRFLYWTGYFLFVVGIMLLADYLFFYRPFIGQLRGVQVPWAQIADLPRHISEEDLRLIGSILTDRDSSFVRFEQDKPEGVVRLCAFGDSFTYGDETAPGHDYPSLLQSAFENAGARNVQVLNFGSSWHGFHQSFIIWERIGRGFGCDAILLGPASFQANRDLRFNHSGFAAPYYLHARYVLDGDGVRLIPVAGTTQQERFDAYFSFFPRLDYLRYDLGMPAIIQGLISTRRVLPNPFYYVARRDDAPETYRRLLRRMAEGGAPIVLTNLRPDLVQLAGSLGLPEAAIALAPEQKFAPYLAPGGHLSAWGNELLAAQYFSLLVQDAPSAAPVLRMQGIEPADPGATVLGRPWDLGEIEAIEAWIDDLPAAVLTVAEAGNDGKEGRRDVLAGTQATTLVVIAAGAEPLDITLLPVDFDVAEGSPIELVIDGNGAPSAQALPQARRPSPELPLVWVTLPGAAITRGHIVFADSAARGMAQAGSRVQLVVAGHPVLHATTGSSEITLRPVEGDLYRLVPERGVHRSTRDMTAEGNLELRFYGAGEAARHIVVGRYLLGEEGFPEPMQRLHRLLRIEDGRAYWIE